MNKVFLYLFLIILPATAWPEWVLHQSKEGHWISGKNKQHHQLIVSRQGVQKQVLLIMSLRHINYPPVPHTVSFMVDDAEASYYKVKLVKERHENIALQLEMTNSEQDELFNQLVHGLNLKIQLHNKNETTFSLNGFTNTFSDFLIANDVGLLDPHWLQMQGYQTELTCYEIARAMVSAMTMRQMGRSIAEVEHSLAEQLSEQASAALDDIIDQAYSIPQATLPRIPSTRKYAFFKRCLARMN